MLVAEWNNSPLSKKQQEEVLAIVSRALKLKKKYLLSVAFVTPGEIKKINRIYRGKNKVTDVLSFTFSESEIAGEILICLSQAKKQAKEFGYSLKEEIEILLVHGLLHVFGFDHLKAVEAKKMFTLKKKILQRLDINWLGASVG